MNTFSKKEGIFLKFSAIRFYLPMHGFLLSVSVPKSIAVLFMKSFLLVYTPILYCYKVLCVAIFEAR